MLVALLPAVACCQPAAMPKSSAPVITIVTPANAANTPKAESVRDSVRDIRSEIKKLREQIKQIKETVKGS